MELREGTSKIGGGSAPVHEIPTCLVALKPTASRAEDYEVALRRGRPPVIARVRDGRLLIDPRTVAEDQENSLAVALEAALDRE